jgi:hypothetical protein
VLSAVSEIGVGTDDVDSSSADPVSDAAFVDSVRISVALVLAKFA